MTKEYVISVDLGGTKILSAILDGELNIVKRYKIETDATKGADYLVNSVAECVRTILSETNIPQEEVKAICMGVPGTVNPEGIIGNAPNLQIKSFNIREALQKFFEIPVFIENDVNLAALGIKKFEFKDDVKNMLVVFLGTGIGSGLIFNGRMYRGSSFFAGEIGHMLVNENGSFSGDANNLSTFENLASRTAVVKAIEKDIAAGKKSKLSKILNKGEKIKSKSLAKAVAKEDEVTIKHIDRACKITGTVLGSITTLLNVDTIVLGGGVIEAMEEYTLPKIKDAFYKAVLKEPGKDCKIVPTKLGDDAAIYGGVSLADEFLA
ncbi:MAG: ROK family protein [Melioribacteraceae bacterium]|nr:ROK family protein [Melioribacteraceae bacterium]